MDQFEREDSSNYGEPQQSQPFEPTRDEPPVQPPVPEPAKPKKSKAPLVLAVLLVLALVGVGALGWMWYTADAAVASYKSDIVAAEGRANDLRTQLEAAKKETTDDDSVTTDTSDSDSETVIKTAIAYRKAPVSALTGTYEGKVEYLKNGFAKVVVTNGPAGSGAPSFAVTLKKSGDVWLVLSAAEGPVADMDELMTTYGIPREAF